MTISNKTRSIVGLAPGSEETANALGVVSTVDDRMTLSKADEMVLRSQALTVEDDPWNQLPNERITNLIKPVYDPVQLLVIAMQNNTLLQCVDAMEVNVDGTGFDIERKDEETVEEAEEDDQLRGIKDFFNTAFINESFTSIRRRMRRDLEQTGNAYLEVIRNAQGQITLMNYLDAKLVRMVRLDEPVEVEREIIRNGEVQTVKILLRERRFAQLIGNKVRYYREFGSSRNVNCVTGDWTDPVQNRPAPMFTAPDPVIDEEGTQEDEGEAFVDENVIDPRDPEFKGGKKKFGPETATSDGEPDNNEPEDDEEGTPGREEAPPFKRKKAFVKKADEPLSTYYTPPSQIDDPSNRKKEIIDEAAPPGTEVIQLRVKPDITTPYGVPRWLNQLPSVLGSRKAEELNLEYFIHGGLPPIMILLQGGQLAPSSKDTLNKYLSGEAKSKVRGVIVEVYATGGSLEQQNQVKAQVERFGGEQQKDSMFELYDERCAKRVRGAWRLPPLFTGSTEEYNFATAYASYLVAEAQVFKPERELFDDLINASIMREIAPDYVYRSLPLTIHDVNVQLAALGMVLPMIDGKEAVDEVNEIAGLNVRFTTPMPGPLEMMEAEAAIKFGGKPGEKPPEGKEGGKPGFPPSGGGGKKFGAKPGDPVGVPGFQKKPMAKPKPQAVTKASRERIMKLGSDILDLAGMWAAHAGGDRVFSQSELNWMTGMVDGLPPGVRPLFNAYVAQKLAPDAKHDPDGVLTLLACATRPETDT